LIKKGLCKPKEIEVLNDHLRLI